MLSSFKCGSAISRVMFENSPIEALRFLDLIDISIWANPPTPDSVILEAISEKIITESSRVWFRQLTSSIFPYPLSINDFRRALLRDFHVKNFQVLMTRYDDERSYFRSQEFLLKISYHDSIEGLHDKIKFRDMKALKDKQDFNEVTTKLKSIIAEKDEKISLVSRRIEGTRVKRQEELGIDESEANRHPSISCNCQTPQNHIEPGSFVASRVLPTRSVQWRGSSSLEDVVEPTPSPTPKQEGSVTCPRTFLDNIRFNNGDRTFSPRSSVTTTTMDGSISVDCDELQAEWDREIPNLP